MSITSKEKLSNFQGSTPELSENINLLSSILNNSIKEHVDEKTYKIITELQDIAQEASIKGSEDSLERTFSIIDKLDTKTITNILKAFTAYFHLVNESEKIEIIRINKEREVGSTKRPRKESIREAIFLLKENGMNANDIQNILNNLNIQPVFTAHPTEAKRPALLRKLKTIATILEKRQESKTLSERDSQKLMLELKNIISVLWSTPEVRDRPPTVIEEINNTLHHLRETVIPLIPELYFDLNLALKEYYPNDTFNIPTFLKFGSWVGGDRDGNPNVTAETTKQALRMHSLEILNKYKVLARELRRETTIRKASGKLLDSISSDEKNIGYKNDNKRFYRNEPYRKKFWFIEKKLESTINSIQYGIYQKNRYKDANEFIADLQLIQDSLIESKFKSLTEQGPFYNLLIQANTFGFHLAELDIRQHSDIHELAISEILKANNISAKYIDLAEEEKEKLLSKLISDNTKLNLESSYSPETKEMISLFQAIKDTQESIDSKCIRCYIISFTQSTSDLLEVLLLANQFDIENNIDIVPLFETVDDLRNSSGILQSLFKNKVYSKQLKSRNSFQEIMLGFSDSGKDGGYLSANIELFKAQDSMTEICKKNNIGWRFFHGRGGSIGRGGAQAGKAIQSSPEDSVTGKIRFTEQGEVLAFRYSLLSLAYRHFEAITHSVILSMLPKPKTTYITASNKPNINSKLEVLAQLSKSKYQSIIYENESFWNLFEGITPYNFISMLNIASRPTSRSNKKSVGDIRAITWGFSLTQVRLMINSWLGVGTALNKAPELGISTEDLQDMYQKFPFFKVTIDNCQQAIAKANMKTASKYLSLIDNKKTLELFNEIMEEYQLTCKMILELTNQKEILDNKPVIKQSIKLRNPYTDPLNCAQVKLLNDKDSKVTSSILLSINGIAAAMQETG